MLSASAGLLASGGARPDDGNVVVRPGGPVRAMRPATPIGKWRTGFGSATGNAGCVSPFTPSRFCPRSRFAAGLVVSSYRPLVAGHGRGPRPLWDVEAETDCRCRVSSPMPSFASPSGNPAGDPPGARWQWQGFSCSNFRPARRAHRSNVREPSPHSRLNVRESVSQWPGRTCGSGIGIRMISRRPNLPHPMPVEALTFPAPRANIWRPELTMASPAFLRSGDNSAKPIQQTPWRVRANRSPVAPLLVPPQFADGGRLLICLHPNQRQVTATEITTGKVVFAYRPARRRRLPMRQRPKSAPMVRRWPLEPTAD